MLRAIPSAASFTFERHDEYLHAVEAITKIDSSRVCIPDWHYRHCAENVEHFARPGAGAVGRDLARFYAMSALSILHRIEHK